ncbi:hypothetical protein Mgra_00003425 [Meloidogyne graminicola]|uniref:Uncharacterized protein n=1 Tax=Meloidogyne graminicola TaxID=189291 RepID=A0A8S9ZUT2_9BILA|nr:hypothetical protein Mgra_00003425 [Meloidogyne graminicola]
MDTNNPKLGMLLLLHFYKINLIFLNIFLYVYCNITNSANRTEENIQISNTSSEARINLFIDYSSKNF